MSAVCGEFLAAWLVAVFDGKPFGVSFPIDVTGVPLVAQVAEFVDQDIIEVDIGQGARLINEG